MAKHARKIIFPFVLSFYILGKRGAKLVYKCYGASIRAETVAVSVPFILRQTNRLYY